MIETFAIGDLLLLLPEICLAMLALTIQMLGVSKLCREDMVCKLAIFGMIGIVFVIFSSAFHSEANFLAFNKTYGSDISTAFYKGLVLIAAIFVMLTYIGYHKSCILAFSSEYIVLMILVVLGAFIAISARDLLILFVGIELQALASYVLAAFDRNSVKSSEAGLKYFILGALSSCIMLLGMSFLYGFSGSTLYTVIHQMLMMSQNVLGLVVGIVLLFCSMMFKFSVAPFHVWTPDIYEGSPAISVSFFGSVTKIAAFVVIINVCCLMMNDNMMWMNNNLLWMIRALAMLSMLIGSIGAVMQTSVKRLIGYSTILNMGYVLIPFVTSDRAYFELAVADSFLYLIIYVVTVIGLFAILVASLGAKVEDATLSDLEGLSRTKKVAAVVITIFMFSMIGLPPFAGFFGKYYVVYSAIQHGEYLLVFTMILTSVIAAYYYLKIIKAMYFCEICTHVSRTQVSAELITVLTITTAFVICFSMIL